MLRVTTLHASSAAATAAYYAKYLAAAPGEVPGVWSGQQAAGLGLSGTVDVDALELLLSGRDPVSGTPLGRELVDRYKADGRVVRAVSGFDATFSAPKSLSVWWALTGDYRLLAAHDVAVAAALKHVEQSGSTTRIRSDGRRLHPDTNGLTMATFRQTTSRADDPQIHTHAVISSKVQTVDGRWLALDGRYLKRQQRMLGGLYQSVLRAELTNRFEAAWGTIVHGQAEIVGVPAELMAVFSKRSADIDAALAGKVAEFRSREGRDPSRWERAALTREASADTRTRKSGQGAADLATRWQAEAAGVGWTGERLRADIDQAGRDAAQWPVPGLTVAEIVEAVSATVSTWGRADVLRAICDVQRPVSSMSGHRWAAALERAADWVVDRCVDLDPATETTRRQSDGRSVWIEPTAPRFTSDVVLAQEEHILTWAMDAQTAAPAPSTTLDRDGLDVLQADAAASVAGDDGLVLVVGPAGAGKTRMLRRAVKDLQLRRRPVAGLAPTAKAARTLERDTGMPADTVAKLLHEWHRPDRPPSAAYSWPAGTTVVLDEAGMLATPALHQLVQLAERQRWRLTLVGDPRQLQGVGRGGLLAELCSNGRVNQLEQLHRFANEWEAAASLLLRSGDPRAFDVYEAHDRIIPGTLDDHLARMAATWIEHHQDAKAVAMVASTNDHVDIINEAIQRVRLCAGHFDVDMAMRIGGGELAHVGDVVATRRNDRRLVTSMGDSVRNRETWTVCGISDDGALTVSRQEGRGFVTLPADYVREHVRLGYSATEHGYQSDTVTTSISLASTVTTRRGLYVAATRGRDENLICVITASNDIAEARDLLDGILAVDRADIPAITQRRNLAEAAHRLHRRPESALPRCHPPTWFEKLRADIGTELAHAESERADATAALERVHASRQIAEGRLAHATQAYEPHRAAIKAAQAQADHARRRQRRAHNEFANTGFRHRPAARRLVEAADDQYDSAMHHLKELEYFAEPQAREFREATHDLRDVNSSIGTTEILVGWSVDHERIGRLRTIVTALDSWKRWADGHDVPIAQLERVLHILEAHHDDPTIAASYDVLANVVRRWAGERGLELAPRLPSVEPSPSIELPSLGIEL